MELLHHQTKNLQKSAPSIFKTMYSCMYQPTLHPPIQHFMLVLNIVINLTVFLSMPNVNILNINHVLSNQTLILALIIVYGILLIQFYGCYVYNLKIFFCAQLQIFRNILGPILINCLFYNILQNSNSQIPAALCIILIIFYYLSMLVLLHCFHKQKQNNSIKIQTFTKSFFRFQSQILLYCINLKEQSKLFVILSVAFLIYCVYRFKKSFQVESNQNYFVPKLEGISSTLFLFYSFILVAQSIGQVNSVLTQQIVSIFVILFLFCFLIIVFQRSKPIQHKSLIELINLQMIDTKIQHAQKYLDVIEPIAFNLYIILHQNRFDKIVQNELTQFWVEHQKYCKNLSCIQQSKKINFSDLLNNNEIDLLNFKLYLSQVIERIMKAIYNIDRTNIKILLGLLRFYSVCLPSRQKCLELISEISIFKQNFSFSQRYFLYQTKELVDQIISEELSGQLKYDKQLFQFENTIYLMTNAINQFWLNFLEQKVNLDKLIQLNQKIQPYKRDIQRLVKSMIKKDNFSTLKMYQIYSQFCLIIQNNQVKSKLLYSLQEAAKKILQQRRQLQYLSYDSQMGIIAISLSENSLGQIRMINTQASMIFGYSQNELKGSRVNQIMSSIHSQNHDDILNTFLLNYKKSINTDERHLLGKNKLGYLFPIYLQLQKTCGDNLKQLTFIANIKKFPIKKSFIACIIDEEGQIKQVSSMFKNLFFYSKKNNVEPMPIGKNIQQIINDFFCLGCARQISQKIIKIDHKYYGKIDMGFQIQGLSFPKKKLAGYTIIFKILNSDEINKDKFKNLSQLSMTKQLIQDQQKHNLLGHEMKYNQLKNVFQLQKNVNSIKYSEISRFTIPYINMNDMGKAFSPKNEGQQEIKPSYQCIRTIRLRNGHFQRAEEDYSFYSQQDKQTRQKNSQKQNFQLLKDKSSEDIIKFIYYGKICYLTIFVILLALIILKFEGQTSYSQDNQQFLLKVQSKYKVRKYLSQYITTYQLLNFYPTNQYLLGQLKTSHQTLINTIQQSYIQQIQKQNILKIDFLQIGANLTQFFQAGLANFNYALPHKITQIKILSNTQMVIIIIEIILAVFIYFYYIHKLESIFQSLLVIDDKIIKQTIQKCVKLSASIENSIKSICPSQEQNNNKKNQVKYSPISDVDEQNQNKIKISKKSISQQKFINLSKLLCFFVPALLFLCYASYDRLWFQKNQTLFLQRVNIFQIIYQTAPQSNVALMNVVLQYSNTSNIALESEFTQIYQKLENSIKQFQEINSNYIGKSFFSYYLQNICNNKNIQLNTSQCKQIQQGILEHGLSPTINTFATKIKDLQNSNGNSTFNQKISQLLNLFTLQNQFVLQIIEKVSNQLKNKIISDSAFYKASFSVLFYVSVALLAIKLLYALIYPFELIKEQLTTSSLLKNIIPSQSHKPAIFNQENYINIQKQLFKYQ